MLDLPKRIIQVLRCFEEAFSERVWEWVKVLLIGAILAPGERTVTAILRVMGLHQERQFQNYHRVLNRAAWSSRALSRLLLRLLIQLFVSEDAPIVVGINEITPRRRGAKIAAKGIYRDPVRSSKEFFVKTSGLRWISMMLLTPIPWVQRVWALPFFTVLAPSERYNQQHRRHHKKLTDWRLADPVTAWQSISVAWYGGTKRTVELASKTAVWYHNGLPPVAIRWVLIRDPQGQFDPQALLCTDQQAQAQAILQWFVLRWQMEVTFHEVRAHLGVETQRQWSNLAILRTTPALLALFSLVTVFAHQVLQGQPLPVRQAAWYTKDIPTFSDTLAFVRQLLWPVTLSYLSPAKPDIVEIPRELFERFIQTLAFAA